MKGLERRAGEWSVCGGTKLQCSGVIQTCVMLYTRQVLHANINIVLSAFSAAGKELQLQTIQEKCSERMSVIEMILEGLDAP